MDLELPKNRGYLKHPCKYLKILASKQGLLKKTY